MEIAKITSKGQITIPIAIRKLLGVKEGDKVLLKNWEWRMKKMLWIWWNKFVQKEGMINKLVDALWDISERIFNIRDSKDYPVLFAAIDVLEKSL